MRMTSNLDEACVVQGACFYPVKAYLPHCGLGNSPPAAYSGTLSASPRSRSCWTPLSVGSRLPLDLHFVQSQALSSPVLWRKIYIYSLI